MKNSNTADLNFYKEIFDNQNHALIIIDQNLNVIEMNDTAEELFKLSRKKTRDKHTSYFLPEDIDQLALKCLSENRVIEKDEIQCNTKDGKSHTLHLTCIPYYVDNPEDRKIILQIKDITLNKIIAQLNVQKETNSMFENLILGLCHELKNPLSGIRGASQILQGELDSKDHKKTTEIIIKEIDRLSKMIDNFNQLQLFSDEIFNRIDIHEILSDIIFIEQKSITSKNIEFTTDFDVTIPHISGDKNSLKQALLNLIKNCIEAVNSSYGKIEITTRWNSIYKLDGKSGIYIDIKDNGIGIPKDKIDKIFSPFFTTKNKGTGLGLFFSQQIINKHGGYIQVSSEPDNGTSFAIYLPDVKKDA